MVETWLIDHRDCRFPWPVGREQRERRSSLPRADLVALRVDAEGGCLAFGEVKTASEAQYPPESMHGRTGLNQQLEDPHDTTHIRDDLLKCLCHRAYRAAWMPRFQLAARRYLTNKTDVWLLAVLVRDVQSHSNDFRAKVESLGRDCLGSRKTVLFALYLPAGRVRGIGDAAIAARTGAAS